MKHLRLENMQAGELGRAVVTIGNFDGVHRGHQQILRRLRAAADEKKMPAAVITFEPHPLKVLNPNKGVRMIYPYAGRERLLARQGVDVLVTERFTHELAETPAEKWVVEVLVDLLQVDTLIMGYDFSFGRGADGDAQQLIQLGKRFGFVTEQVPALVVDGRPISSSRIRRLIEAGEVSIALNLLGRPFHLTGEVIHGDRRLIGFPTANLKVDADLLPHVGVYGSVAAVGGKAYAAAVNVGWNPTFEEKELRVEAHLLDFTGDLYGQTIEIHFLRRWRDEKKFGSVEQLAAAIRRDIDKTKQLFADQKPEEWLS
jgi:riboflavin kinase/FMN adenylyltransferase